MDVCMCRVQLIRVKDLTQVQEFGNSSACRDTYITLHHIIISLSVYNVMNFRCCTLPDESELRCTTWVSRLSIDSFLSLGIRSKQSIINTLSTTIHDARIGMCRGRFNNGRDWIWRLWYTSQHRYMGKMKNDFKNLWSDSLRGKKVNEGRKTSAMEEWNDDWRWKPSVIWLIKLVWGTSWMNDGVAVAFVGLSEIMNKWMRRSSVAFRLSRFLYL